MDRTYLSLFVILLLSSSFSFSQQFQWENAVELSSIPNGVTTKSTYSSPYGQHVLVHSTPPVHYLFGNDGTLISSNSFTGLTSTWMSLTGYADLLTAVFESSNDIKAYRSSDGGATWSSATTHDPGSSVTVQWLDAHADANGTHIVWNNETLDKVYYVFFDPSVPAFDLGQEITGISSSHTGYAPKVTSSSGRVHVSFIRTDLDPDRGVTRDRVSGTWESDYKAANALSQSVAAQSIALRGDSLHIVMYEDNGSGTEDIKSARRAVDNSWTNQLLEVADHIGADEDNWHDMVTNALDTLYAVYTRDAVLLRTYPTSSGLWSSSTTIESSSTNDEISVSSSKTGVYVFWNANDNNSVWLRRRVLPLNGTITQKSLWTGKNYVNDNLDIDGSTSVTARAGSETYVLANKKIVVKSGATLNVEPGAKFYFETGASLEVQGTLTVSGTSGSHALFTRRPGTSKWGGIVIQNSSSAPTASLSYADIFSTGTAVKVGSNANFSMSNCKIDTADIGFQVVSSGSGSPAKTVSQSTIRWISQTGVDINNFSNITFSNNTITAKSNATSAIGIRCDASSPKFLENTVDLFGLHTVYCTNGSSPVFENGIPGGYNDLGTSSYAVTGLFFEYDSDAILGYISGAMGDVGGQNNIGTSLDYSVYIKTSDVKAENCYWYIEGDPSGSFAVDEGSIDYDPWLEERAAPSIPDERVINPTLFSETMGLALEKRTMGEYAEAASLLRSIVAGQSVMVEEKIWALRQLLAVSQMLPNPEFASYVVAGLGGSTQLNGILRRILPAARLNEGQVSDALAAYDANIQEFPNSGAEKAALYAKFMHALSNQSDSASARFLLRRITTSYPLSVEARLGRVQLENFIPRSQESSAISSSERGPASKVHVPVGFSLEQNYPNPFNPTTTITYSLPRSSHVSLSVYDLLGREVATLVDGFTQAGSHSTTLNALELASGVYFYRLVAGEFTETKRLVLLK